MTNYRQDGDFKKAVVMDNIPEGILQDAINWIGKNMNPDDVFTDNDLTSWAIGKEIDSIYPAKELEDWATNNGFIKE